VLIGSTGSGKSSFAQRLFKPTEIVSSDMCRGVVSDDENNQSATNDAFELLHYIVAKRLKNRLLTVVDATNVQEESRRSLLNLAREYHCLPVAIVLNLPEKICQARNAKRPERSQVGAHVIPQHIRLLKKSLKHLSREGFKNVHELRTEEEVNAVESIVREPLYNNKMHETGNFDIIGDIHGCFEELTELMQKLGYQIVTEPYIVVTPPEGRRAIFLGDLTDRGENSPDVLRLVMGMVKARTAFCVVGNHDAKLLQKLNGKNVQPKHGLAETLEQLSTQSPEFVEEVRTFLDGLISHYLLDGGRLVVAHAGLKESMQGRASGAVRAFCLYGETTGEIDEFGLPVRLNWAMEYRGKAMVVYGHTPIPRAEWLNNTMNIDTGCVFGGKLTALRYPERELIDVPAKKVYCEPVKPLISPRQLERGQGGEAISPEITVQQLHDSYLDIADVLGKQIIPTRLHHHVIVREENSIAALEVMSRFAVNPKWLIYLPPTMSPTETSKLPDLLEHPAESFAYFASQGVEKVVCEEKHMGSRTVVVLCKDEQTVFNRFGIENEGIGACYTRTGRSFFNDTAIEQAFLQRIKMACDKTNFWEKFQTDWVCLDCELMPWSAKAQALLQNQYAAVGTAATHALPIVNQVLQQAKNQGLAVESLYEKFTEKEKMLQDYVEAYRRYCWEVNGLGDYKLAPFHILATENQVHTDKDHVWQMENIAELCEGDTQILFKTPYKIINLNSEEERNQAISWWEDLTAKGGEGMVIKPFHFIAHNSKGLIQPAVKCRGREYLRIIYGAEYTASANLERLRQRGISSKRSLALREFALGMESLELFVRREPLRKVHQCVFGVLALESEPIDPRL
nr:polynucleotide kinase-phosphatase [Thermoflexibacter sp.]